MKKILCLAAAAALLLFLSSGCVSGKKTEEPVTPEPDERIEEAEKTGEDTEFNSEFDITISFDKGRGVRRYTLNEYTDVLELYYEIPVFGSEAGGKDAINTYFEGLAEDFFKSENVLSAIGYAKEFSGTEKYCFTESTKVMTKNDKLISVTTSYDWYMGGVADYGSDSWTFDAETGKLLKLSDIAETNAEELISVIFIMLENELPNGDTSLVQGYGADDFEFSVENGEIYINLDKYEASDGASGAFHILIPVEIKTEYSKG